MDDILRDFVIETTEAIDVVDAELVKFEQEPNNGAVLAQIFRLVHTVKGTCGFLGLPRLEALAHAAETVIGQFRDGVPVTTQAVSLILSTIDKIKDIIGELERNASEPEGDDAALIDQLENMARQQIAKKSELVTAPEHTTGSLVYQVLERRLRPGEVSLDDLEMAFRDAPGPGRKRAERMSEMFEAADAAREVLDSREAAPAFQSQPPKHTPEDFAVYERLFVEGGTQVGAAPDADSPSPGDRGSTVPVRVEAASQPTVGSDAPAEKPLPSAGDSPAARQTLRVAIDTIDHLMTMVSELVLTRNQLLEIARRQGEGQFKVPLQRLSSITAELQEAVMKTRMQPIAAAWAKLPRLVRDLSVELGKQIELETSGADTEIDRHVLELIRDPLVHMIRNAADHGLESPEERIAAKKSRVGKIRVSALQEGGYIILEVADDGKGLDLDRVAKRALTMGLATEDQLKRMSDLEVGRFIFKAGFSTAKVITSVSGRGVGMDVVNSNVEQVGGSIDVRTRAGLGTTISIKIPVTLAIASALVVEVSKQRFAIPQISVVELVRAGGGSDIKLDIVNGSTVLRLRNELLPVTSLTSILRLADQPVGLGDKVFIVICQVADRRFGLIVDSVVQTEEIVVKPTSVILHSLSTYSGVTILGDGSVVMIIDPAGLGRELGIFAEGRDDQEKAVAQIEDHEPTTSLLVFRSGDMSFKAVPLELVTRLEEIDGSKVEVSGGQSLIQYRGKLMPLIAANGNAGIGTAENHHVLVFACGNRTAGLVVDQIIDIVDERLEISAGSASPGLLGSAIIGGRATDIIDIAHFLPFELDQTEKERNVSRNPAVLIVDDSGFFRAMLVPVVKAAGYRVFAAGDANVALQIMNDHKIDAVVVDLNLSGINGFELAQKIRLEKFGANVPILGLVERGGASVVKAARERGFADLIGKFDRQGLIASLNDLLNAKSEAA